MSIPSVWVRDRSAGRRLSRRGGPRGQMPFTPKWRRWCAVGAICAGFVLLIVQASVAFAAGPANHDFDHAAAINATPFSDHVDPSGATTAPDDPTTCSPAGNSVWFTFTVHVIAGGDEALTRATVTADTFGRDNYAFCLGGPPSLVAR